MPRALHGKERKKFRSECKKEAEGRQPTAAPLLADKK